jgi:hypothetical protein
VAEHIKEQVDVAVMAVALVQTAAELLLVQEQLIQEVGAVLVVTLPIKQVVQAAVE